MTRAENYVTLEFLSRSSNEGFAREALRVERSKKQLKCIYACKV